MEKLFCNKSKVKIIQRNKNENPFELEWIFGHNSEVEVVNLTHNDLNPMFAISSSHILHVFDVNQHSQSIFLGHERKIVFITSDATGRFLISVDESSLINIWDQEVFKTSSSFTGNTVFPIKTIRCDEMKEMVTKIALSEDGKNLLIGQNNIVMLRKWSFGREDADDTVEFPDKYGMVVNLKFSCNKNDSQMFVITAKHGIMFGILSTIDHKIKIHHPKRSISISTIYKDTIFVEKTCKAISITENGRAVIWSELICENSKDLYESSSSSFRKEYIKCVNLRECAINVIKSVDGVIAIGDKMGNLRFYDNDLKILYWCPHLDLGPISSISFHLNPRSYFFENSLAMPENELFEGQEILFEDALPKDISYDKKTFLIRNFFISTNHDIIYVNFTKNIFERVLYKSDDFLTALDVHPFKSLVVTGNYSGRIVLYDYKTKLIFNENQLNLQSKMSAISDTMIISVPHISCIAYSENGFNLTCGLDSGSILNLEPLTLAIIGDIMSYTNEKIECLKFSKDSSFLVFYDATNTVGVLYLDGMWTFVGKYRFHIKPICDVLFIPQNGCKICPRLISLGQDQNIVEYDVIESIKESSNKLVINFTKRIFQTPSPIAMALIFNKEKNEELLLISDNEKKFRLFDKNTFEILHTYIGPQFDGFVRRFDVTGQDKFGYFVFQTRKSICLYSTDLIEGNVVDGNPYRVIGAVGACDEIKIMTQKVQNTDNLVFTVGKNCKSLLMWSINLKPLQNHLSKSGYGLQPYCELIPGGIYGKFFQEMQDLFFYMQIIAEPNIKHVKDFLDISEIPDFMRGLGFYPTDYEIDCCKNEMVNLKKKKVTFEDLTLLYLNYSCLSGNKMGRISKAITNLVNCNELDDENVQIKYSKIQSILMKSAEAVDEQDSEFYIRKLQEKFSFEDSMSLTQFLYDFLSVSKE